LKLYCHPISLIPWRVHIALHEKGQGFEEVHIDVNQAHGRDEAFLRLNPFGQIPVLDDDGFVVADSIAILEYLEEKFPEPALMPPSTSTHFATRARIRQFMCWSSAHWMPGWKGWIGGRAESADGTSAMAQEGRSILAHHLDVLQGQLDRADDPRDDRAGIGSDDAKSDDWLVGEFSLADVCYAPLVLLLTPAGLKDEVSARPSVADWVRRLRARPSVETAMGAMLGG